MPPKRSKEVGNINKKKKVGDSSSSSVAAVPPTAIGPGGDNNNFGISTGESNDNHNDNFEDATEEENSSSIGSTVISNNNSSGGNNEDEEEEIVVVSASLNVNAKPRTENNTSSSSSITISQKVQSVNLQDDDEIDDEILDDEEVAAANNEEIIAPSLTIITKPEITTSSAVSPTDNNESTTASASVPTTTTKNNEGQDQLLLPPTVTTLLNKQTKIHIVGTAHFSSESKEDVRRTIQLTQPDRVLLELCHSRRNILQYDEETLLREAGDIGWAKIRDTLSQSNTHGKSRVQSLLHLVLLSMSANLTKKLGMAPGGEFRAGVEEARKIPNCSVILGDRPFDVTLQRAIASLSLYQKIKLGWQFLSSSTDDITKEEIEKCKEKDLLEKMLLEMTGEFPSITEVFVNERDCYLAHSLWLASEESKNGTVVGVVGMGHVPGIVKWFGKTEERVKAISYAPPPSPPSLIIWTIKTGLKLTLYGGMIYGGYKFFNKFDLFKKIQLVKIR